MLNINSLLKKKGWTGRELGRLEMVNTLDGFRQSLEGVLEPKPIISKADFRKMLDTITDPQEGRIYNGYIAIHKWFSTMYLEAVAQEQQAHLNYNTLSTVLTNAMAAEDIYSYIAELPVIMTEKQYKETVEKRKEEILHSDGEERSFNIFNLLEQALNFYIGLLQKKPRKKNPLKPLKKKLEKDLVTDPKILSKYNKVMENGYYTTPDGARSDSMEWEEWQALIDPPITSHLKNAKELGEKEVCFLEQKMAAKRVVNRALAIYDGATDEEADDEVEKKDPYSVPCEWHYYEETPKNLNKWEILETGDLFEYYPALSGEGTDEEMIEDIKAFIKEFPEVVKALLTDMERFIKGASSLPVEAWLNTCYTREDLYKLNFYNFRSTYVDTDTAIFSGNRRALNGVAILRANDSIGYSPLIDKETGYYKEPDIRKSLKDFSLEGYFTENEDYAEAVEVLERARRLFRNSYYFLLGYNKALDIVASYFNLEELEVAKLNTEVLKNKAKGFNSLVAMLYVRIKDTAYQDEELKAKKMKVLKDVLYPISLEDLVVPEEKIEKAKRDIKDFKAFKDEMLDIKLTLCYLNPEDEEGA